MKAMPGRDGNANASQYNQRNGNAGLFYLNALASLAGDMATAPGRMAPYAGEIASGLVRTPMLVAPYAADLGSTMMRQASRIPNTMGNIASSAGRTAARSVGRLPRYANNVVGFLNPFD
jgi:hypothetical protein